MAQEPESTTPAELRELEKRVNKSDDDGIRARWESGRCMLKLRNGKKRLQDGVLAQLCDDLCASHSELTDRTRFAEKFAEAEVATVIASYRTWDAIRKFALPDRPKAQEPDTARDVEPGRQDTPEDTEQGAEQDDESEIDATRYLQRTLEAVKTLVDNVNPEYLDDNGRRLVSQITEHIRIFVKKLKTSKAA